MIADIVLGDTSAQAQASVLRGHTMLASFRRGKGEVFNSGTTEWAHGLAVRDPFVETITHNVLRRFGVSLPGGAAALSRPARIAPPAAGSASPPSSRRPR